MKTRIPIRLSVEKLQAAAKEKEQSEAQKNRWDRFRKKSGSQQGGGEYAGTVEGTVLTWMTRVGERIEKGFGLVEIETAKANTTVDAPASGILVEITFDKKAKFGLDTRDPDAGGLGITPDRKWYKLIFGWLETEEDDSGENVLVEANERRDEEIQEKFTISPVAQNMMDTHGISPQEIAAELHLPGGVTIGKEEVARYLESKGALAPSPLQPSPQIAIDGPPPAERLVRPKISRPARVKAAALGIAEEDFYHIRGSGPQDTIIPEDVERYWQERTQDASDIRRKNESPDDFAAEKEKGTKSLPPSLQHAPVTEDEDDEEEIVDIPPWLLTAAQLLQRAWQSKPQAYSGVSYNLLPLISFRQWYRKKFEGVTGVPLQLLFPLLAAVVRTLTKEQFASLNGKWEDGQDGPRFNHIKPVHLGIAHNKFDPSSLDPMRRHKLLVLTIPYADTLSLVELAREVHGVTERAVQGTVAAEEVSGGYTFIFNNVGGLQSLIPREIREDVTIVSGYSLLTEPVSALMAVYAIDALTKRANVQLTFDHRAVAGGGLVQEFLNTVYEEMVDHVLPELQNLCDGESISSQG